MCMARVRGYNTNIESFAGFQNESDVCIYLAVDNPKQKIKVNEKKTHEYFLLFRFILV